ncbi:hypothetical protein EMIHUDRAFT_224320 [Emiliania huxleyi CCMP1516]|uniref:Cullin N-terminal domain-containing protein n=2 Tax=Emiliania huxleyi TaxID=2903 RepID=A0A0D3KS30_EMIH1|nr:hypothetical protein EMIHUDRAFT_224320 [Emiliania huxleyi CCMP1516]EOD38565.1 hypothetical protein EMIHUDRAFT_224320 [Emiliania huxleyi CCMP1516]|eukprot:XP_005790994.1 hypothetical protein EMIHUDRAFT_224320 [Emiliania huxleyi CCMP1516]
MLLATPPPQPADPPLAPLYVAGDSHALSPSWRVVRWRGQPRVLVTGLKLWHLRDGADFFPKANFEAAAASLPDGADVVFAFGEIDCREGLLLAVERARYRDLAQAIDTVVDIYIRTLRRLAARRRFNILVPPVLPETRAVVKQFNAALRRAVERASPVLAWLDFFEQLLTPAGDALADGLALDGTHLNPQYVRLTAPRKLTIKPLRTAPKLPANFEQATWAKLLDAVRAVHGKRAVNHSLEELYRGVEDMCVQHMAARTYDKLQAECEAHVEASIEALQTPDTSAFLSLVHGCWSAHCEEMLTLHSIFLYLDRTYVMQSAARRSLWEMGLHSFRAQLSARPEVLAKLRDGVLASIERERGGDQVERSLLAELLRMLYDLGLYQRHFEEQFPSVKT